jgi:hypothetical protein
VPNTLSLRGNEGKIALKKYNASSILSANSVQRQEELLDIANELNGGPRILKLGEAVFN